MSNFDIDSQKNYEDIYGHTYTTDSEPQVKEGGRGFIVRTTEPDIALKIITDPNTNTIVTDDRNNEKYIDLRILPIPDKLPVALPQFALKGVEGYAMMLPNDMCEFAEAFALDEQYYWSALQTVEPDPLLKFFAHNPEFQSPDQYARIYAYMKTGGLRRRLAAYMKAAAILTRLHTAGLVFCDFSDRNAFVSSDQNHDHVLFVDADNLNYSELIASGFYTPGFGAPEIMRGEGICSFYSDCFSFATALFQTVLNWHPFDGKAYRTALGTNSEEAEQLKDCGGFAWILNDEDDSNDGRNFLILSDELLLTDGLRELFRQTFCGDACRHPILRPTMLQWVYETAFALDNVIRAESCGSDYSAAAEHFADCPYDGAAVSAIRLKSYLLDDNDLKSAELWQFTHETVASKLNVPMRILNGFKCREIDAIAFSLQFEGGKILLQTETADYAFSYKDGADGAESQFRSYGGFCFAERRFSIKCRHNKTGRRVLIEGEFG